MAWENYGHAYVIDQQVGVGASGRIVAWDYEAWLARRGGRPGRGTPGNVVTGVLAGFAPATPTPRSPSPPPSGRFRNRSSAAPSYVAGCINGTCGGTGTVQSERVLTHTVESPFFTGPLRSPSRLQNTFAHECLMDEVPPALAPTPWRVGSITWAIRDCERWCRQQRSRRIGTPDRRHGPTSSEVVSQPGAASPARSTKETTAIARWWPTSISTRTPDR